MRTTDERLNQLANDPMMCNITHEVQECLRELIVLRKVLQLAEHKIEQHLQGQYQDGAALRAALRVIKDPGVIG